MSEQGVAAAANAYRPILRFDSGDPRRPLDVEEYLAGDAGNGRPQVCAPTCKQLDSLGDLRVGKVAGAHLDLAGAESLGGETKLPQTTDSPVYYDVSRANGHVNFDYWVFYDYNDSPSLKSLTCVGALSIAEATCFDHEGDWEGLTVSVPEPAAGGETEPDAVIYATHNDRASFAWSALQQKGSTRKHHPFGYVAAGSHATYPLACPPASCRQLSSDLPDGQRDGERAWTAAGCAGCVKPLPIDPTSKKARGWAAFHGLWGAEQCTVGLELCTRGKGPQSPSDQKRYIFAGQAPDCTSLLLQSDPKQTGRCPLGPG